MPEVPHRKYKRTQLKRYSTYFSHTLGFRGRMLLLFGAIWIGNGLAVIGAPGNPTYPMLNEWDSVRATAWIVTGAIACWAAWRSPGLGDRPGFAALYIMALYHLIAYGIPFIDWMTGGGGGSARGITGVLLWLAIIGVIILTAKWPEPSRVEEGDA